MAVLDTELSWLDEERGLVPLLGRLHHVERDGDTIVLHADPPFAEADWEQLPDDGPRYELLDGCIVVTPSPVPDHSVGGNRLWQLLDAAAVPPFEVYTDTDLQMPSGIPRPDVIVLPSSSVGQARLRLPAALVVEVLSKGSVSNDRKRKRASYARAEIPSYWILDRLRKGGPRLEVLRLDGPVYVEEHVVEPDETWTATLPYPVTITPRVLFAPKWTKR